MSVLHSIAAPRRSSPTFVRAVLVCLLWGFAVPLIHAAPLSAAPVDHLVVSEVMTGGASASDELIEIYNPSAAPLPLEGLELIYVSATGATVSRRAAWGVGAPAVPPGAHVLVVNELGVFASIADAVYASGMASTGGSVAIRIQGATTAIDAMGWGTAAGTWLEGTAVPAPPAGASLERLPGGPLGSTSDTDDNAADFTVRSAPDPQNSGSPAVPDPTLASPTPSPDPTATPVPTPTSTVTPAASGTPGPTPSAPPAISIASARALADGSFVTIEGTALTASDFTDGGGYVADASGGIAVMLDDGSFARGNRLRVQGTLDDRFSQRTLRAVADDVAVIGSGGEPAALAPATGSVNEAVEGRLVRIRGAVQGRPTILTGGLAFDVDDGSGVVRAIVGTATGIDSAAWVDGAAVDLVGVVGQRDSSGTGAAGYRVQPRDPADVGAVSSPTPSPSAVESPGSDPTSSASQPPTRVVSIADARAAAKHTRLTVRGIVTLASGTVDPGSAVLQDASGGILLRLGDEAGDVSRGELLEVDAVRSTWSGMESLRVSVGPRRLGSGTEPAARALRTADASEASEAHLVSVRGALVASARRASSGTVSFEIDDGSGPLRIVQGSTLAADDDALVAGTWIEVRGVLGQVTTGAQPLRGYRVWPRGAEDLRILASPTDAPAGAGGRRARNGAADGGGGVDPRGASLEAVGEAGLADLRVGATLVAGRWPELGVAGLLWDGMHLVGISPDSAARVDQLLVERAVPVSLEMMGLHKQPDRPRPGISLVRLGPGRDDTIVGQSPIEPPSTSLPAHGQEPRWMAVVGRLTGGDERRTVEVGGADIAVEWLCRARVAPADGVVSLVGIAVSDPQRILVGCEGVRPAPALGLAAPSFGLPAPATSATGVTGDSEAHPVAGRRLLAAGLLVAGMAIVGIAALMARRWLPDDRDAAEEHTELAPERAPVSPQLTLVGVPNEHSP